MSDTKYILVYPFESREKAFDVANNIDGSLMWQNGTAYPRDNIPAFIVPLDEFSGRWTEPNEALQLSAYKEVVEAAEEVSNVFPEGLPEIDKLKKALSKLQEQESK